jgi:hypothetical protein
VTRVVVPAVTVAAAAVLLVSVAAKVGGRTAFAGFVAWVELLRVVPGHRARTVAIAVVTAEAAALGLLVAPGTRVAGLAATAALVGFFAASAHWLARHGRAVPCHCFGAGGRPMGVLEVTRNAALALACAGAAAAAHPVAPPVTVGSALLGLAAAAVVLRLDDIVGAALPERSNR